MRIIISLITAAYVLWGGVAQAQENPLSKIADGVYHFWSMGYSSLVVIGDGGILVTDPSFTPRAEVLKAELIKITDKPVTHIALSHEHFDHVGGTEVFVDAKVILQENGLDILKLSPLLPMPTITESFDEKLVINLGSKKVELHHLAVGDGVATTIVRVPSDNVIFSADLYMPKEISPKAFKDDTNFVGVQQILNTLVEWDPSYAVNGHSDGNSVEALKENAEFTNKLFKIVNDQLAAALATGDPMAPWNVVFNISTQVQMPEYSDWKNYETAFPGYVGRMALSIMHGG